MNHLYLDSFPWPMSICRFWIKHYKHRIIYIRKPYYEGLRHFSALFHMALLQFWILLISFHVFIKYYVLIKNFEYYVVKQNDKTNQKTLSNDSIFCQFNNLSSTSTFFIYPEYFRGLRLIISALLRHPLLTVIYETICKEKYE